jgi:uncharacterized protein (DUF58 family)
MGLSAAGVLLLVVAFWLGYPELAVLGSAAVVAVSGGLAFVAWRPRLLVTRTADPDRVMRGEASQLALTVANASRLFGASLVARDRLQPGGHVAVPLLRLRPGQTTEAAYPVPTQRRGVVAIGPLEVSRRDPLGLVRVARSYGGSVSVWVRPRVHPIAAVPVGLSRSMDGRIDRIPSGAITFAALREYVVGDDLRHVHWRTSARVGELMVREHVDTSLPRIVVLLDDRSGAHEDESFEDACEAAASVVVAGVRAGVHVELQFVRGTAAASGHDDAGAMLDLLAEATLEPGASLADAVARLRVRRVGDTLLYLTGPPNEGDLGEVAGLRGAYPSIIAGVFGSVETGLGTTAGLLVVGARDGADFAAAWDGVRAW